MWGGFSIRVGLWTELFARDFRNRHPFGSNQQTYVYLHIWNYTHRFPHPRKTPKPSIATPNSCGGGSFLRDFHVVMRFVRCGQHLFWGGAYNSSKSWQWVQDYPSQTLAGHALMRHASCALMVLIWRCENWAWNMLYYFICITETRDNDIWNQPMHVKFWFGSEG